MKLRAGAAFLILVCVVIFSLCFGAYRGWSQERSRVEENYAGLESMLRTRVESAYNVLTVARRHLNETDEALQSVIRDRNILEGKYSLSEKARANEALTRDAGELLQKLAGLESVSRDERDSMYVTSYLPQMLTESEAKAAGANYNSAAAEFNEKLQSTFSGWIARVLGIRAAEEFIAQ